jgi:hypothetical protein
MNDERKYLTKKVILKASALIWSSIEKIHEEEKHQVSDADACDICLNSYPIRVAVWAEKQARASEREKNLESAKRQMDLLAMEMTKKRLDEVEEARVSVDIPTEAARYIEQNVVPEPLRGAITKMLKTERPNIMHLCAQEAGWRKKED